MERSELFDLMGELQLYGMKAAFDEIMTTAVKRQHEPQRIIGDLLTAEINEKETRSIKYQLTGAQRIPLFRRATRSCSLVYGFATKEIEFRSGKRLRKWFVAWPLAIMTGSDG
jgi:hypothetical protein